MVEIDLVNNLLPRPREALGVRGDKRRPILSPAQAVHPRPADPPLGPRRPFPVPVPLLQAVEGKVLCSRVETGSGQAEDDAGEVWMR